MPARPSSALYGPRSGSRAGRVSGDTKSSRPRLAEVDGWRSVGRIPQTRTQRQPQHRPGTAERGRGSSPGVRESGKARSEHQVIECSDHNGDRWRSVVGPGVGIFSLRRCVRSCARRSTSSRVRPAEHPPGLYFAGVRAVRLSGSVADVLSTFGYPASARGVVPDRCPTRPGRRRRARRIVPRLVFRKSAGFGPLTSGARIVRVRLVVLAEASLTAAAESGSIGRPTRVTSDRSAPRTHT